jgi:hypothetical protein
MAEDAMKFLRDASVLVSATELGEVIGVDLETINNWLRRGIISRAPIGGRQLRHRLFSTEEVYKAALTQELVRLGTSPSSASDAVIEVWKVWDKKELPEGKKIYAVMLPTDAKWTAFLCWQKISGGPLYRLSKSSTSKAEEIELPKQALAMLPLSEVVTSVTKKLEELMNGTTPRGQKVPVLRQDAPPRLPHSSR